jgi:hypothetical protein
MNAEHFESRSLLSEGLPIIRLVTTFWGVAVIAALAVFTLVDTVTNAPDAVSTGGSRGVLAAAETVDAPHVSPFANFVPPPAPPIERLAPVLYIACGPDDLLGRGGGGTPGRYPITMRLDQVPDDIRAVLNGTDTVFPKDSPVVKTACIQGKIDRGELP